jgi:hypothetical protein
MAPAISAACVSRAKCPVSKKRTTAFGMSRLNAFGPLVEEERFVLALGRQKGGWFPLFVAIPATTSVGLVDAARFGSTHGGRCERLAQCSQLGGRLIVSCETRAGCGRK